MLSCSLKKTTSRETFEGKGHIETGSGLKRVSRSEKTELWTWPKVSHRLFRACQCTTRNSVSNLSGTTLYDAAVCC